MRHSLTCHSALIGGNRTTVDVCFPANDYAALMIERGQLATYTHQRHSRVTDSEDIRYDTIGEFNVDSKAEYSALSSTRSQKKKLKQTTPVPF